MDGDTASDEDMECPGAAGREGEMPSQTEPVEMPSKVDPADEVPVDMECSGAPEEEGEIEMLRQDQQVDDMECSGREGDVEMLSQSLTAQVPNRSQGAMVIEC